MKSPRFHHIILSEQRVKYELVRSKRYRKLRLRVGPEGVKVLVPASRTEEEAKEFLKSHAEWVLAQLHRADQLRKATRSHQEIPQILYRGEWKTIALRQTQNRSHANRIVIDGNVIWIDPGSRTRTSLAGSLENWFRAQARLEILALVAELKTRFGQEPHRVYIMDQRTKWGNCSSARNLSFSWRLILAPPFVLRYIVIHEMVHLALPDHSNIFWLTVQSLCPEMEKAKSWLRRNRNRLLVDLNKVLPKGGILVNADKETSTLQKDQDKEFQACLVSLKRTETLEYCPRCQKLTPCQRDFVDISCRVCGSFLFSILHASSEGEV